MLPCASDRAEEEEEVQTHKEVHLPLGNVVVFCVVLCITIAQDNKKKYHFSIILTSGYPELL